jgi:hypothetical protein
MIAKLSVNVYCVTINNVRQAPAYYWQYFDFMLKRALDENCNIICLGNLNINFMANIPTNIRDIIFINSTYNINKTFIIKNNTTSTTVPVPPNGNLKSRQTYVSNRFRKTFLRVKSVLTESKYKQQRKKVNN